MKPFEDSNFVSMSVSSPWNAKFDCSGGCATILNSKVYPGWKELVIEDRDGMMVDFLIDDVTLKTLAVLLYDYFNVNQKAV